MFSNYIKEQTETKHPNKQNVILLFATFLFLGTTKVVLKD